MFNFILHVELAASTDTKQINTLLTRYRDGCPWVPSTRIGLLNAHTSLGVELPVLPLFLSLLLEQEHVQIWEPDILSKACINTSHTIITLLVHDSLNQCITLFGLIIPLLLVKSLHYLFIGVIPNPLGVQADLCQPSPYHPHPRDSIGKNISI